MLGGLFPRFGVLLFKTHGKTVALSTLRTATDVAEDVFGGVFTMEELPDKLHLLVANTDPASHPAHNWACMRVKKDGRREHFDSLERRLTVHFERYMDRHYLS